MVNNIISCFVRNQIKTRHQHIYYISPISSKHNFTSRKRLRNKKKDSKPESLQDFEPPTLKEFIEHDSRKPHKKLSHLYVHQTPSFNNNNNNKITAWDKTFYRCRDLQDNDSDSIFYMMNFFNTINIASGVFLFTYIYRLHGVLFSHIPISFGLSWTLLRFFTSVVPVLPILYGKLSVELRRHCFPVLETLHFSRKFPDPKHQSVRSTVLKRSKGKYSESEIDSIVTSSFMFRWRVLRTKYSVKYGITYDIVENISLLVLYPLVAAVLHAIGFNAAYMEALLADEHFFIAIVFNEYPSVMRGFMSFVTASYAARMLSPLVFRFWALPRTEKRFPVRTYS